MSRKFGQGHAVAVVLLGAIAGPTAFADTGDVAGASLMDGLRTPHADWSASIGATRTDNAAFAEPGTSDTIANGGLQASVYHSDPRLLVAVDGSATYQHFVDHTFGDHVFGALVGRGSYSFVPDHFSWRLDDTFGQVAANTLAPATPTNRVNTNRLNTGPDVSIALSDATDIVLGGRYADTTFGNEAGVGGVFDQTRWSGTGGVRTKLSPVSSIGLDASTAKVDYKSASTAAYDQSEAYIDYTLRESRYGASIEAGGTQLKQFGETQNGPLLRLTVYRQLSPSWSLNASAGRAYESTGDLFASELAGARVVNGQVVGSVVGGNPGGAATSPVDVNLTNRWIATTPWGSPLTSVTPGRSSASAPRSIGITFRSGARRWIATSALSEWSPRAA